MSLHVRLAYPQDLPRLAPIGLDANRRYAEWAPQRFEDDDDAIPDAVAQHAIDEGRLLVAELEGEMVGWLFATRLGEELCLGEVCVAIAHGRRGVGRALLDRFIDEARSKGERTIVLNAERDAPWAAPWYARLGFEVIASEDWTPAMRALHDDHHSAGLTERVNMRLVLPAEVLP